MFSSVTAASGTVPEAGVRPPTGLGNVAPRPDAAASPHPRPTVLPRPEIVPAPRRGLRDGVPVSHPYVRTFWTAAIGPGAVADLMRLAVAAQRGRSLPLPPTVPVLSREGLVSWRDGRLLVGPAVPALPPHHLRRLPPVIRRRHSQVAARLPRLTDPAGSAA